MIQDDLSPEDTMDKMDVGFRYASRWLPAPPDVDRSLRLLQDLSGSKNANGQRGFTARDQHPLSNGWFALPFTPESRARTGDVLAGWADDISRAHHLQFLAWRLLREEWAFEGAPITLHDRFFIPDIATALGTEEVFIDAGAHHGYVTKAFSERLANRFSSIVAIEPDADNRATFREMCRTLDPAVAARITLLPDALDSTERDRPFHDELGYASQLADSGSRIVTTRTIDGLGLSPTMIKLHLEGGELNALKGALATIRTHRPIIVLTTYHNDDGIFRTPTFLMRNLARYRFLMRLHSWCGTGAVIYAIPLERLR